MKCRRCGSNKLRKNGTLKLIQRGRGIVRQTFYCKNCGYRPSRRIK